MPPPAGGISRRRAEGAIASSLAIVALTLLSGVATAAPSGTIPPEVPPARAASVITNVTYNATSDGFPLSFAEILPAHFHATATYPLLVYLHGAGKTTAWTRGGSGNGLTGGTLSNATITGQTLLDLVANASSFGYVLIAPSPRSAQGFYTNSTCGGPEEQDTMDAIHVEEARHRIGAVYLYGDSMGSLGALSFAAHRRGVVTGVATTGTLTDAFEQIAYRSNPTGSLAYLTCGVFPSPRNVSADRVFSYLSVTRFVPTNLSGVLLWITTGAQDNVAPNNASVWPYLQANDSFLTSTCRTVGKWGEPANCTTPFATLRATSPSLYDFRFIWEPNGTHLIVQLDPRDLFDFFGGLVSGGCVTTTTPPTTFAPCP